MTKSEGDPDVIWNQEEFINKIKTNDEFAKEWGDLGPIYGKQWRNWAKFSEKVYTRQIREIPEGGRYAETRNVNWVGGSEVIYIDQIQNLINDLKTNPDSRRLMVSAWNVGELGQMTLPPCHYGFQVYTRELSESERFNWYGNQIGSHMHHDHIEQEMDENNVPTRSISLMWNQRSVDTFLGLPFNIASYGLLLEIIAKEVNMIPDELIGNLGDTHLYLNHLEQAKEQIGIELGKNARYNLLTKQMTKLRAIRDEDYIKYNIPTRTREPYQLPTLNIKLHFNNEPSFVPEHWLVDDFEIVNYQSHQSIKAPLSN